MSKMLTKLRPPKNMGARVAKRIRLWWKGPLRCKVGMHEISDREVGFSPGTGMCDIWCPKCYVYLGEKALDDLPPSFLKRYGALRSMFSNLGEPLASDELVTLCTQDAEDARGEAVIPGDFIQIEGRQHRIAGVESATTLRMQSQRFECDSLHPNYKTNSRVRWWCHIIFRHWIGF